MTIHTRRASTPAYYLGRPAALWLTALAPRQREGRLVSGRSLRSAAGPAPGQVTAQAA
jgi:hypothetical protein